MGVLSNSKFSPPPLTTPITAESGDRFGVPYQERSEAPLAAGNLNVAWAAWINQDYAYTVLAPRMVSTTQANLTKLAKYLSAADAAAAANFTQTAGAVSLGSGPFLALVTDYNHVLQWTGTGWQWGPGEPGSGMMQLFEVDPTGAGWHLYDGTANVPYLKSDGTLGTRTLQDLTSAANLAAYLKAGSPNAGPNAAVAPTFAGTAMGAHAHELPIQLPATGLNSIAQTVFGSGTVRGLANQIPGSALGGSAAVALSQAVSAGTPQGTISNDGEPRNLVRRAWFRQ